MITYVIKRDGRKVKFNEDKIANAVRKALLDVYQGNESLFDRVLPSKISKDISRKSTKSEMSVEEIQDLVEVALMNSSEKEVAKSYILFRDKRSKEREKKSKIMKAVIKRTYVQEVENMNANVDERSFSGREKEASGDVQKILALDYELTEDVSKAHREMLIYQHDLDKAVIGSHNCLNIDFKKLFTEGFSTRNGDVRPPKSFTSACQLVAVIFQCQSQVQFGGVGSIHLDLDLAPCVKMSFIKHVKQNLFKNWLSDNFDEFNKQTLNMTEDEKYEYENKKTNDLYDIFKIKYDNDISLNNEKLKKTDIYAKSFLDLEIEGRQACQGLYHNLNTLESRQGKIGCRI